MAPPSIVDFEEVCKDYPTGLLGRSTLRALADISLRVEKGEVFGLLGPNRAGKTTLVKILLSLCRPTKGKVYRLGRPIKERLTLSRVGFMHENQAFPRYWTAPGLLEYYGALTLMSQPEVRRRVHLLLDKVHLSDRSQEPIARFSKGMVQRLALAQALINEPDLLVMDEPMEGLDLNGRQLIRDVISDQRCRGQTVLIVSHVLDEVANLCDRAAVVVEGRLVYQGNISNLTKDSKGISRPLEQALSELYEKHPS